MTIAIFILIQILSFVSSLQLEDAHQNGVTFSVDEQSEIHIAVDENNNGGRIRILLITDAHGQPQISSSYTLEPKIEKEDSNYVLTVNILDSEALVRPWFLLKIQDDETTEDFEVTINNVDDESPKLEGQSCYMEEETPIDVHNSQCYLSINDPDGWLGTMKFTIDEAGAEIFELKYKTTPEDDVVWGYAYLVLKEDQKLDFETKDSYEIQVKATDGAGHPSIPENVTMTISVTEERPVWTSLPFIKQIVEESETSFIIAATDNDTNSNHEVKYSINDPSGYCTINPETGNISVASIDREKIYYNITVTVTAYYSDIADVFTTEQIFLVIDDIDDNAPLISRAINISVSETSKICSGYTYAQDLDSDENSIFSIDLKVPDELSSAFNFTPKKGFGYASITITGNSTEIEQYFVNLKQNNFQIELTTTGIKTPGNTDTLVIIVYDGSKTYSNNSSSGLHTTWVILLLIFSVKMILM